MSIVDKGRINILKFILPLSSFSNMLQSFQLVLLFCLATLTFSATKSKPHTHDGLLKAYDGKHIAYSLDVEQTKKLDAGQPITINEKSGKSGRGIVVQDINAPPHVCMDRIRDLANYSRMVPNVKRIDIYGEEKFPNGTIQTDAMFNVGVSILSFGYYLLLTYEPRYNTYTWTLNYKYNSDFDDNTGHWQAMPHPTKAGWTRVLYSTEVKLFAWIPEFVITFLTKTALIESTTWVKRESEKVARANEASKADTSPSKAQVALLPDVRDCFVVDETGSRYETHCSERPLQEASAKRGEL